jgi:hypothetical protein
MSTTPLTYPQQFPEGYKSPNLGMELGGIPNAVANALMLIDAYSASVYSVVAATDQINIVAGYDFTFTPTVVDVSKVDVIIVGTLAQPAAFAGSALNVDLQYNDTFGRVLAPDIIGATDDAVPGNIVYPVFATSAGPVNVFTSFVTFGVPGALPSNAWYCPVTITGTGAAYGATLTQANPNGGCTAFFYGVESLGGVPGNLLYTVLTGTDDFDTTGPVFIDAVSGTHYTAAGAKAVGTFTGPGFGVSMTQFVTGAFGGEMNIPTTNLYLGPRISGVADIPSGIVHIPGPVPDATHGWYDPVNGGVFIPTHAPILQTFSYDLHIRLEAL